MKTRHDNDTEWTRLVEAAVDGELDGAELARLRAEMAEREDLRSLEAALLEMRELVQMEVEAVADATDLSALWSQLEARIVAEAEPSIDPLTFQAFADGELPPHEAALMAARVAESTSARARLEAIAEMGDLVRTDIEAAAESADYGRLWARIDAEVGDEIEARGGFQTPGPAKRAPSEGWFQGFWAAIGGYRSLAMSAATAVAAVLVMLLVTRGGSDDLADHGTQALEIRVVHINELRSDPGYNVSVDQPAGDAAPVIFIRPADSAVDPPSETPGSQNNGLFENPI